MDRAKKIDIEVKKLHRKIKRSNLLLQERMQDICEDMKAWDFLGDNNNGESREGYLR
jgi:hypothetical protein